MVSIRDRWSVGRAVMRRFAISELLRIRRFLIPIQTERPLIFVRTDVRSTSTWSGCSSLIGLWCCIYHNRISRFRVMSNGARLPFISIFLNLNSRLVLTFVRPPLSAKSRIPSPSQATMSQISIVGCKFMIQSFYYLYRIR